MPGIKNIQQEKSISLELCSIFNLVRFLLRNLRVCIERYKKYHHEIMHEFELGIQFY